MFVVTMTQFYLQENLMQIHQQFAFIPFSLLPHELKNLIKEKTYFKNALNPICIDLFLKSIALSFQNNETFFSTDLSEII